MGFYIGRAQADQNGLEVLGSAGSEWVSLDPPNRLSVPQNTPAPGC